MDQGKKWKPRLPTIMEHGLFESFLGKNDTLELIALCFKVEHDAKRELENERIAQVIKEVFHWNNLFKESLKIFYHRLPNNQICTLNTN